MSRGRLVVHGHFYQPSRADPFSGRSRPTRRRRRPTTGPRGSAPRATARTPSAATSPTCRGTSGRRWRAGWSTTTRSPTAVSSTATRASTGSPSPSTTRSCRWPPPQTAGRRSLWGLRDFAWRFGRPALGLWLPETAVDRATLRLLADLGIRHTILAPWQASEPHIDTRRPYRVELGGGRSIAVAFYDGDLSGAVSFEPRATADADRFAQDVVESRMAPGSLPDDEPPLVVIATDGELYGHHQTFAELFLETADPAPRRRRPARVRRRPAGRGAGGAGAITRSARSTSRTARRGAATTASCAGRPNARACRTGDGRDRCVRRWSDWPPASTRSPTRSRRAWPARPIRGRRAMPTWTSSSGRRSRPPSRPAGWAPRPAKRHRRRSSRSWRRSAGGWRCSPATAGIGTTRRGRRRRRVLRAAARAARLADGLAGAPVSSDGWSRTCALFSSPGYHVDGAEIYRRALAEVGQAGPADVAR